VSNGPCIKEHKEIRRELAHSRISLCSFIFGECRDNEQALACESVGRGHVAFGQRCVGRAHLLHHSFSYKHLLIIAHMIAVIVANIIINI